MRPSQSTFPCGRRDGGFRGPAVCTESTTLWNRGCSGPQGSLSQPTSICILHRAGCPPRTLLPAGAQTSRLVPLPMDISFGVSPMLVGWVPGAQRVPPLLHSHLHTTHNL